MCLDFHLSGDMMWRVFIKLALDHYGLDTFVLDTHVATFSLLVNTFSILGMEDIIMLLI